MINKIIRKTEIIKGERIPIWLMRQAGRYLPEYHPVMNKAKNFLEACFNPEIVEELTLQPIKRFNFDAAIIFSDILILPYVLGCKVEFIKNLGPVVEPISDSEDLLDFSKVSKDLSPIFESIKRVREKLSPNKSLIGFAGSPWTIATYILEGKNSANFSKTKKICYENDAKFSKIIDKITEATAIYLLKQIENGVDVIQLFDSHAGHLSVEQFKKWVIEPTKHITTLIKQNYPSVPIIGFPKGAGVLYREYSENSGVSCVSIDYSIPLEWAKNNIKTAIQGNLDPFLLAFDKRKALFQAQKILETFKDKEFVFNLGHGVIPETPVDNVEALVNLVKNFQP